jgi:hypothetical protein
MVTSFLLPVGRGSGFPIYDCVFWTRTYSLQIWRQHPPGTECDNRLEGELGQRKLVEYVGTEGIEEGEEYSFEHFVDLLIVLKKVKEAS